MAHKKGAGSSKNGRESHSKRLGVKIFGGQQAIGGNIIVRQRGTKHHPDKNVGIGKDHTLFALIDGKVLFTKKRDNKSYVSIVPDEVTVAETTPQAAEKKATDKKVATKAKAVSKVKAKTAEDKDVVKKTPATSKAKTKKVEKAEAKPSQKDTADDEEASTTVK